MGCPCAVFNKERGSCRHKNRLVEIPKPTIEAETNPNIFHLDTEEDFHMETPDRVKFFSQHRIQKQKKTIFQNYLSFSQQRTGINNQERTIFSRAKDAEHQAWRKINKQQGRQKNRKQRALKTLAYNKQKQKNCKGKQTLDLKAPRVFLEGDKNLR